MKRIILLMAVAAVAAVVVSSRTSVGADTRVAPQGTSATPYMEIKNEPAPKLIVDPPLAEGLAIGLVWIQYRVENIRILPVFGAGATKVSPRVGHLHISVDDFPFWWADASDNNTIDIAGLPVGRHTVRIDLTDANHRVFPGQSKTVTFNLPVQLHRD